MLGQIYDVIVIGGGPGGYPAAIAAAEAGLKVALIEKGQVGGTCLNRGCIPTKTLLESAKLFLKIKNAGKFGIKVGSVELDYRAVVMRKNLVVTKLTKGVEFLLKNAKVDLIRGAGKLLNQRNPATPESSVVAAAALATLPTNARYQIEVSADGKNEILSTMHVILATGSENAQINNFNIDEINILTSSSFLNLESLPKSILIIGGGVMGIEFAGILAACGVKVTLIEAMNRVLPSEDEEVSQAIAQMYKKLGVEIYCGQQIESIIKTNLDCNCLAAPGVAAKLVGGQTLVAEKALITIGRRLNTQKFPDLDIKMDGEKVIVNDRLETNLPGVYAVGDITGKYLLAHVATAQGKIAAANCAGKNQTVNYAAIPLCVYSLPEIARVGITETAAKEKGLNVRVVRFPYRAIGRAKTMEAEDGFIKIIVAAGKIIGVTIIGEGASEIIHEAVLAIQNNLSAEQVAKTIHAHPSLSEGIMEAFEASGKP